MKFDLILVDPAWPYAQRAVHTETRFGGGAVSQYPILTDIELFNLKDQIHQICEPNCLMLMWTVYPKMDIAIDLVRAWEFKWSTRAFTWLKVYRNAKTTLFRGPGAGTASNDEVCIAAYRGKYQAPVEKLADGNIYEEILDPVVICPHPRFSSDHPDPKKRGKIIHSAKPEEVRNRIDRLWPYQSKLEIFARSLRPGWTAVGLDLTGNDIRVDLDLLAQGCVPEVPNVNPGLNPEVDEVWKNYARVSYSPSKREQFLAQLNSGAT